MSVEWLRAQCAPRQSTVGYVPGALRLPCELRGFPDESHFTELFTMAWLLGIQSELPMSPPDGGIP
jgi:hypothetical protein